MISCARSSMARKARADTGALERQIKSRPEIRAALALLRPGSACLRRRAQVFLEEGDGATPGDVGLFLIVARCTGVGVEGVLRARIGMHRELLVVLLQRFFEGRHGTVHALIVLGVMQQQWRLD